MLTRGSSPLQSVAEAVGKHKTKTRSGGLSPANTVSGKARVKGRSMNAG